MSASQYQEPSTHYHASADTVLSSYKDSLKQYRGELLEAQGSRSKALVATICSFLLMACLVSIPILLQAKIFAILGLLPGYATLQLWRGYKRSGNRWRACDAKCDYYESGIRRLTNTWQGTGRQGLEFRREGHLYQEDLNILGLGSLFELICTTRSSAGARRLASYLLDTSSREEALCRQQCVSELRGVQHLREQLHQFGQYTFQDCSESVFDDWFNLPILRMARAIPLLMLCSSVSSLLLGVGLYVGAITWGSCGWFAIALATLQLSLGAVCISLIRPRLRLLLQLTESFAVLQEGLGLMENQDFQSPRLKELVQRVRSQQASAIVCKVERLFRILEQREKPEFYLIACFLAVGTQAVIAIERWRACYQEPFKAWLDAWAEFEALLALGGYAYEQEGTIFPELIEGPPLFRARSLGHPLLAADKYVGNDVTLDRSIRFYIVSGSNMAGKSTLLRSIGLNAVLAMAGATVRAASAQISSISVCASLSVSDSLLEGKSKFLAEVERISHTLARARSGQPTLFLIDEILSGTNSQDRRASVELIIEALLAEGAIGALSTHDLALTEIAGNLTLSAALVHMASQNVDNPLDFDYRLHPGIAQRTNALALVRMMGITERQRNV